MERYGRKFGDEKYRESRELLMSGFSWPPRSYTCTFCKREFRSAQALGGHMNVHRRDRARLRHHSPPSSPLLNPNPNPSSSSSSNNTLPNLNFSPPSPPPPPPPPTLPCSTAPLTYAFPALLSPLNGHLAASSPSFSSAPATFQLKRYEEVKHTRAVEAFFRVKGLKDFMGEEEKDHGREIVKLDLEIGMREDLDLELRLGYRNC